MVSCVLTESADFNSCFFPPLMECSTPVMVLTLLHILGKISISLDARWGLCWARVVTEVCIIPGQSYGEVMQEVHESCM